MSNEKKEVNLARNEWEEKRCNAAIAYIVGPLEFSRFISCMCISVIADSQHSTEKKIKWISAYAAHTRTRPSKLPINWYSISVRMYFWQLE